MARQDGGEGNSCKTRRHQLSLVMTPSGVFVMAFNHVLAASMLVALSAATPALAKMNHPGVADPPLVMPLSAPAAANPLNTPLPPLYPETAQGPAQGRSQPPSTGTSAPPDGDRQQNAPHDRSWQQERD
jgi:hypothetical protein